MLSNQLRFVAMRAFGVLALFTLSSCALDPLREEHLDKKPWVGRRTAEAWNSPKGPVCVAFSGGGIRSAAFAMGAAQGLHDSGLLEKVDFLSATSGGGYTAGWLYDATRRQKHSMSLDDALDPSGKEQQRLVDNAHYFVGKGWGGWTVVSGAAIETFWRTAKQATCATKSPQMQPSGSSFAYGAAIRGLFDIGLDFQTLTDSDKGGPLPKLVIATTVTRGPSPPCEAEERTRNKPMAAEFTKDGLRIPSGVVASSTKDWQAAEVITAAGGASDIAMQAGDVDLCHYPAETRPLLGYSVCGSAEADPKVYFATDGGFTDNLALAPLIGKERSCGTIVVVDGTHDPALRFDDLINQEACRLKPLGWNASGLARQMLVADTSVSCPADTPESSTLSAEGRFRGDAADSMIAIQTNAEGKTLAYLKLTLTKADATSCATSDDRCALPASISHWYRESKQEFDPTRRKNGMDDGQRCTDQGTLSERCQFPQQSTKNQAMLLSEFLAYRDLGHWSMNTYLLPELRKQGVVISHAVVAP
jgi:hypothetical protein